MLLSNHVFMMDFPDEDSSVCLKEKMKKDKLKGDKIERCHQHKNLLHNYND